MSPALQVASGSGNRSSQERMPMQRYFRSFRRSRSGSSFCLFRFYFCLSDTPHRKRSPPLEEESLRGSYFWSAQNMFELWKAVTCHRHSKLLRAAQPQFTGRNACATLFSKFSKVEKRNLLLPFSFFLLPFRHTSLQAVPSSRRGEFLRNDSNFGKGDMSPEKSGDMSPALQVASGNATAAPQAGMPMPRNPRSFRRSRSGISFYLFRFSFCLSDTPHRKRSPPLEEENFQKTIRVLECSNMFELWKRATCRPKKSGDMSPALQVASDNAIAAPQAG